MPNTWTDERLDDGFDRVSADIASLRTEVGSLRNELHAEFDSLRSEMRQGFSSLQRAVRAGSAIVAALIAVVATQL